MADRNKFEEMLELLVNEDKAAAEELFHEIVVEKSREIYASMLESDIEEDEDVEEATDEEVDEATDEEVDEAADEEVDEATDEEVDESEEEVDEGFDLDEFEVEADDEMPMGGDMDDMDLGDMGGEEGGDEPATKDDMMDLEKDIQDLKDMFAQMMDDEAPEEDEGEEGPEEDEAEEDEAEEEAIAFESDDEEVEEASEEEIDEAVEKSAAELMREYATKVTANMGDNGANTTSPVASKNDMGGTASNLNQGKDNEAGDHAGLGDINPKVDDANNRNKVGGMSAKKGTKNEPGHGAEKKGAGEEGGVNTKTPIGS